VSAGLRPVTAVHAARFLGLCLDRLLVIYWLSNTEEWRTCRILTVRNRIS